MVELTANIEEDYSGGWCIRLRDTLEEDEMMCADLTVFSNNVEEMGARYGGEIKVTWTKNSDLSEEHFMEVHQEMAKIQEELNDQQ